MPLKMDGDFFPKFTSNDERDRLHESRYDEKDRNCAARTVEKLKTAETSAAKPGMLLGKIQSGKTKAFLGIVALAFDNGFDIAVVLTKGTKALTKQTLARVRKEFATFVDADKLQIYDILTVPSGLTGWELNQKVVFVCKKQSDNLDRLTELFGDTYPALRSKRVLIIDDEADFASIGFRKSKDEGIEANKTLKQVDQLRALLKASAFLQVTATPYSLYLQPDDLVVKDIEFKPVRPAFTELVPINPKYVGSDHYFERSLDEKLVESFIYEPVAREELTILHHDDRRSFKIEEVLTHTAISKFREAIVNFLVGGVIRRLQEAHAGKPQLKYAFLVHTEAAKAPHTWQENIVGELNSQLKTAVTAKPQLLEKLIAASHANLADSVNALGHYLPSLPQVTAECLSLLKQDCMMITKVNSEKQVEELLDEKGQLKLRTPLNIFIGGQILDRGLTIANLIGFFYGRRPNVHQQDTVLQHSRMFGFRPGEDVAVTRFYTAPEIFAAMRAMHESDVALRQAFERDPNQAVVFIQRDAHGKVVPCSPNKILVSNTTTLKPFKRILPVGFQTDYATRTKTIVSQIDSLIKEHQPAGDANKPFLISVDLAREILKLIQPTLLMETEEGYDFDWNAAHSALSYMSNASVDPAQRGKVWCLVRTDRNLGRTVRAPSGTAYADAPDTVHQEGKVAKETAINIPMLMLFRQNGAKDQGWRDTPFYWPVIWAPANARTAIFAHETTP